MPQQPTVVILWSRSSGCLSLTVVQHELAAAGVPSFTHDPRGLGSLRRHRQSTVSTWLRPRDHGPGTLKKGGHWIRIIEPGLVVHEILMMVDELARV